MKCHEIFGRCSPTFVDQLLNEVLEREKPVYKAALENLAIRQKLRPVFVERKPKPERHAWVQRALSRKSADDLAMQVLQIWLLGAHRDLICDFLDSLQIPHDGKGVVDTLPPARSKEALVSAIDYLLSKYSHEPVAVYLHAFQAMDDAGWKELAELLATDPRLKLGAGE
jgi:hypothetical protein